MPTGSNSTSTSPTRLCSNNSNNSNNVNGATDRKNSLDSTSSCSSGGGGKLATMSYDPTPYIQRARVTRPAPPKPSCNPMQFVQIKPCNLYQTAQEQLKKAEEVKKVKEIKKEEPEDWQSNLDNWKSSRRKRVEHIIDRVVEVKKLELEEHDRTRKKSKTFSEMLEERSSRRTKLSSLAVYTEDESNDLSDFGIGTNSISGKSSLSEDYDNNSVMSDNIDTEKPMMSNHHNHLDHENGISSNRDYNITTSSSPGYETTSSSLSSSSTSAPPTANSPDPLCEYTYEGAIQDYKTRVSKTQSNNNYNNSNNTGSNNNRNTTAATTVSSPYSKDSTPEMNFTPRRPSGSKIENRLMNFEIKSSSPSSSSNDLQTNELINIPKKDLPKVDILKRRELFEKDTDMLSENINSNNNVNNISNSNQKKLSGDFTNTKSIRERLSSLEKKPTQANEVENKKMNRLSGDITSLKDRLQYLERQTSVTEKSSKIDVPVVPLKERLSSLQNAVQKEEIKKPVLLVDEHQLEILKKEDLEKQHTLRKEMLDDENLSSSQEILNLQDESIVDTDREDSGIHTTDVSCSVSQTDEQPDLVNDESHHHINAEDGLCQNIERKLQKTGRIHEEKCEDVNPSTSSCIPDVIRSSATEQKSNEEQQQDQHEHNQQQQQEHQTSPIIENDNNMNAMSPEPINDQEASVSLSLSESPTISSSQQTIIFNGKVASDAGGGSLENITSISQLSVEGALGVDYNCSSTIGSNNNNKCNVVKNTNTNVNSNTNNSTPSLSSSVTCVQKNSKFDIDHKIQEKDSKQQQTIYGNQYKYDFTGNANNSKIIKTNNDNKTFKNNGNNSKFLLKTNDLEVEDKINIEKWIEQNFEQNQKQSNDNNIDIESSLKLTHNTNQVIHNNENKLNNNQTQTYIFPNNQSKSNQYDDNKQYRNNYETRTYGEVIFDSKLMSPKINKNLNETSKSDATFDEKLKQKSGSFSPSVETSKNENVNDIETVCIKIRPSKLKSPAKISSNLNQNFKTINSPIQATDSNLNEKRQTIIETCEKINVNDLPDPSHITTPFIDVSFDENNSTIKNDPILLTKSHNSLTKIPVPTKSNPTISSSPSSSTSMKCKSLPNSPIKADIVTNGNSQSQQNLNTSKSLPTSTATTPDLATSPTLKNGIIVAKLEVVETKIKVTTNDTPPKTPELSPKFSTKIPKSSSSSSSPKINTKTHPDSKPKNIFDFLRKNFSSNHCNENDNENSESIVGDDFGAVAVDNSKFYISVTDGNNDGTTNVNGSGGIGNDVNIQITKTIKTDRIVEKADSIDSDTTMTNEINQLLDEELSKLTTNIIEDTRL